MTAGLRTQDLILAAGAVAVLLAAMTQGYLLFHTLAELFSIFVAGAVFAAAWHSRPLVRNDFLLTLGIGYLFVAGLDVLHTLTYKGMGAFPHITDADPATQLWLAARLIEAGAWGAAFLVMRGRLPLRLVWALFAGGAALLAGLILVWDIFPTALVEGRGPTGFKNTIEYLVVACFAAAAVGVRLVTPPLLPPVRQLLILALLMKAASELAFTLYVDVYGALNALGHLLKLASAWALYRAMVEQCLNAPFHRLRQQMEEDRTSLEAAVALRTASLMETNARLHAEEEKLTSAIRELERSNAELEQFAYVASHDLQEPLRMITSYTQLLQRRYQGRLDADADEFIHYATDGATRMSHMIRDLLDYSRVGRKGQPFTRVPLAEAVSAALANLAPAMAEAKADITVGDLPTVYGDRSQLERLMQNLVGNALKYRRPDIPCRITIGVRPHGQDWQISVTDTGIGIAPEFFERIFMIFQRLHGPGQYPGTGIGLAICRKIVERHGGTIWVESESGKGATFTLPMLTAQPALAADAAGA